MALKSPAHASPLVGSANTLAPFFTAFNAVSIPAKAGLAAGLRPYWK